MANDHFVSPPFQKVDGDIESPFYIVHETDIIMQSTVEDVTFCVEFRLFVPFCSRLAAGCGNTQDQEPANQVSLLRHPDGAAIQLRTTIPSA